MSAATFRVSEVVQIAPSRQLGVVVAITPAGGVSVMRHPSGHVTPFLPGALDERHKRDARCACRGFDDGGVHTSRCPIHADTDPCQSMAAITGRRRTGTIRRGVCTACGWVAPVDVSSTVEKWHASYQRGLITLDELASELAKLDRQHGAQPVTRPKMLAQRAAAER